MARELANNLPAPWEKYLPQMKNNATVKSARQVQKSFARITSNIGTPASTPKPRGNPLAATRSRHKELSSLPISSSRRPPMPLGEPRGLNQERSRQCNEALVIMRGANRKRRNLLAIA